MNIRTDIKIVIVGDKSSGKETFCKMLFLDENSKIKVDPLSKISEVYFEIDQLNFKNASRKIMHECKIQNELILRQSDVNNITDLRKNNIEPLFYKHTNKIKGLIDYRSKPHLNKNILLTYYVISNNYLEFREEISKANIIIYICDGNKEFDSDNELFNLLISEIIDSDNKKYLLTVINKCDDLDAGGNFNQTKQSVFSKIDQAIREKANDNNLHQNLLSPILLSSKYSRIYRQIIHNKSNEMDINEETFISNLFNIKKEHLIKDIQKNQTKYLRRSGYAFFNDTLSDILNTKYKIMVNMNFDEDLFEFENNISNENILVKSIEIQNKATRLSKIFKEDYQNKINSVVKKILENMLNDNSPNINIVDTLIGICDDNSKITPDLKNLKINIFRKITDQMTNKIYNSDLTDNIFLPSKIHEIIDTLFDLFISKTDCIKLSMHICDLYSVKARLLLNSNLPLLYASYFSENEFTKMTSILNEIMTTINFDTYKIFLIQIMLTKLMIANEYLKNKSLFEKNNVNNVIKYCNTLKYYLSNDTNKKYHYLFQNIIDICSNLILNNECTTQILYISENIDSIIGFNSDKIILMEKFIVKTIKKNNYSALIAQDECNSDEDSDVDIYGDEYLKSNFEFTKSDLQSNSESDSSEDKTVMV